MCGTKTFFGVEKGQSSANVAMARSRGEKRGKERKKKTNRTSEKSKEDLLELWKDPSFPGALSGLDAFYRGLRQRGRTGGLSKSQVRHLLEQDLHYQVSRGLRKHFPLRKDLAFGWNAR